MFATLVVIYVDPGKAAKVSVLLQDVFDRPIRLKVLEVAQADSDTYITYIRMQNLDAVAANAFDRG